MVGFTIGRYTLSERLPLGTLGETWLSRDDSLNRSVAITILPASIASDSKTRTRLLQQVIATGSLEHPAIPAVHDTGELVDGRLWVATGWSGGQSLGERLKAGSLPPEEALDIALQVGRALQAAHQAGLVHGDICPENVLVTDDGQAKIIGAFLGRVEDAESDTSALGTVLEEMLRGSGNVPAEFQELLRRRPRGVAGLLEDLERAVGKASSATFRRSAVAAGRAGGKRVLLWSALAAAVAIALGVAFLLWTARRAEPALADRVTIVLLPIADSARAAGEDMLAEMLTDGLMSDLVKIRRLRVVSQNSSRQIRADEPMLEVGRRLGADYVLKGTAARDGDGVSLSFELWQTGTLALFASTNAEPGIWSLRNSAAGAWVTKQFRGTTDRMNALLAQMAIEAAKNASVRATADDRKRIAEESVIRPDARELYLKGRVLADDAGNPASLKKAIDLLSTAVEMEPEYAAAWAALGMTLSQPGSGDMVSPVAASVDEALTRALELDPSSAEVQLAVGSASGNLGRYAEQRKALEAAVKVNPNLAQAHSSYAVLLARYKRYEEALAEAKEGVRLDPLSVTANQSLGLQYIWSRRYADGIPAILAVLELRPDDPLALRNYGWMLAETGRYDEGLQYLDKAVQLGAPGGQAYLGYLLARGGKHDQARTIAQRLAMNWNPKDALGAQQIGMIYANIDEPHLGMEWLRKAMRAGGPGFLGGLDMSPEWDPLRSLPEFREMVKLPDWPVAAAAASNLTRPAAARAQSRPVVIMASVGLESSDAFYQRLHDYIVQQTGVEFTYVDVVEDYPAKREAAIAARSQIDVFYVGNTQGMMQYRVRRVIQDITDSVNGYGPHMRKLFTEAPGWGDLQRGAMWRPVTIDGRIWAIPSGTVTDVGVVLSIRRDWRERLGLARIETIDQFEAYLRKVKTTDLNGNGKEDEIPFNPMYGDQGLEGIASSMTFPFTGTVGWHHVWYRSTYLDPQGRVTPTVLHPEFRTFLARMAEWYRDGLLPSDLITSSWDRDTELVAANRVGATSSWYDDPYGAWQTLTKKVAQAVYEPVALKGPGGSPARFAYPQPPSTAGWVYTAWTPRDVVDAGVRLQDWFAASKDNYLVQSHGAPGVDWKYVEKGNDAQRPRIEHTSDKDFYSYSFMQYDAWNALPMGSDWFSMKQREANERIGRFQGWFAPDWFVPYFFKGTVVDRNNAKAADFINQAIADIITNKAPLVTWDAQVAEYRALWADEFIKAATAQYNKAVGKK